MCKALLAPCDGKTFTPVRLSTPAGSYTNVLNHKTEAFDLMSSFLTHADVSNVLSNK